MLQYQPNMERLFHHVLLDAIPLLFLAPEDYRNALAKELDALYYQYRSGGSGVQFTNGIDTINKMMGGAGDHWGSRTKDQIRAFRSNWQGFDERITALEQGIATRKAEKIKKPVIISLPEIVPEPVITGVPVLRKITQTEQILQYITEHPGETSGEILRGCGITARGARNRTSILCKDGLLHREGTSKKYRYYPRPQGDDNNVLLPTATPTATPTSTSTPTSTPTPTERKVLKYIEENPGQTTKEIKTMGGFRKDQVSKLHVKKLIRGIGSDKYHYRYYPVESG